MSEQQPAADQGNADRLIDQSRSRLVLLVIGLTAVVLLKLTLYALSQRSTGTTEEVTSELADIIARS